MLRARRSLTDIDTLRFVHTALRAGMTQTDLAERLGVSQATVSRMAASAATRADLGQPSVAEIIDRATVKEIDRAEMLRRLRSLRVGYTGTRRSASAGWQQLREARRRHRVGRDEAQVLAEDAARFVVGRVVSLMELEAQPVSEASLAELVDDTTKTLVARLG